MKRKICISAQAGLLLFALAAQLAAEEITTVQSPEFLTAPSTLPTTGVAPFTMAKVVPSIDFLLFQDLPDGGKETLWSSWGDGLLASNGKYYTSLGNHLDYQRGTGQSRIYEYDPATKKNRIVLNVRDVVTSTDEAAGKVHGGLHEGKDGWIYFATYWGAKPKAVEGKTFAGGSVLLRYDPRTEKAERLAVPLPAQGLPASLLDASRMMLYFCAVYSGDFVAYDLEKREVKFRGGNQMGDRNMMLDNDGNVYFSTKDGVLARYNPATNEATPTKARVPDSPRGIAEHRILRASTGVAKNGLIYAMTGGGVLFSFDPKTEAVKELGMNFLTGAYTAVMKLSPDGKYFYYVPGAHGSGARMGTPVVQYNIEKGERKVLAFLNAALRDKFDYNIGGVYNLEVSRDGSHLFLTFNGDLLKPPPKRLTTFSDPSLVVLHIPEAER